MAGLRVTATALSHLRSAVRIRAAASQPGLALGASDLVSPVSDH
jgi:hypothetical protein